MSLTPFQLDGLIRLALAAAVWAWVLGFWWVLCRAADKADAADHARNAREWE